MQNVSRSINIGKTFDDRISKAIGRDRAKVEGSGLFGTDIGADRLSGGISPEEYNSYSKDEQKAVDNAVKDYVNELMGGIPADDDELFSPEGSVVGVGETGPDRGPPPSASQETVAIRGEAVAAAVAAAAVAAAVAAAAAVAEVAAAAVAEVALMTVVGVSAVAVLPNR